MTTTEQISQECDAIKAMLLDKNAKYGDSAMRPQRIFSRADHLEQLKVRIDDKLSRIATMGTDGEDEDTTGDLIGYLVLLRIAQRRASHGEVVDDELGPWQAAIPELSEPPPPPPPPPVRVIREGVEIVPPSAPEPPIVTLDEDPDDDPAVVHIVPDRTSRATMPDECLGALCGRGGR